AGRSGDGPVRGDGGGRAAGDLAGLRRVRVAPPPHLLYTESTHTERGRPMSNYTPTPRHVRRMARDRARDEWLRQAEAHVALARNWHDMGRPEVAREAVEEYVAKALDIANDIRKYALRKQQERARQIEADLAALGFTR